MSPILLDIVRNTPTWVWALLAVLVALGVRAMRPTDVPVRRLWALPVAMCGYSLLGTCNAFAQVGEPLVAAAWLAGAVLGYSANRVLDLPRGVTPNPDGSVRLAGSVAPLLLYLGIFLMRYALGVTIAVSPALRGDPGFALVAALVSGLPGGLLAARSRKSLAALRRPAAATA